MAGISANTNHSSLDVGNQVPSSTKSFRGRFRIGSFKKPHKTVPNGTAEEQNGHACKIEVGLDEASDLLVGAVLTSGVLFLDAKKPKKGSESAEEIAAKLTTKQFTWGSKSLQLEDVVAVSYSVGSRRFTIHYFPLTKMRLVPRAFSKLQRRRKDVNLLGPNSENAVKWVSAFASLGCFVNCLPHPLSSARGHGLIIDNSDSPPGISVNSRPIRIMLVILNPRSGHGRARKVFDSKVEPILKLAGFRLNVVETTGPNHAFKLAATVDLTTCPDGIIGVGGDGIINEVLNGLLSRDDAKQSATIPIGIIPAGSDNSLIWTIMGIRDPVSAAMAIVKGDIVAMDVFAVEWIKTGELHMGHTVAYYGFMSDVLELSAKYQKRFGPLRYFVAGALKILCLPKYECEVEFLPCAGRVGENNGEGGNMLLGEGVGGRVLDGLNDFCEGDIEVGLSMNNESLGGGGEQCKERTDANSEPSDYVRGLNAKTKRAFSARTPPAAEEALAFHYALSPRPRTRSKSRIDRGWSLSSGLAATNTALRSSWDYSPVENRNSNNGNSNDSSQQQQSAVTAVEEFVLAKSRVSPANNGSADRILGLPNNDVSAIWAPGVEEEKWVVRQGPFLGVMICNHQCKTVQCLKSQVLAPSAEHDDNSMDLLLVHGVGRFQLIRFFILMQFGRHLSLPFVEYIKVQSVKLKPGNNGHKGCGIDGELLSLNGPISTYLLPDRCKLIGRPIRHS